MKLIFTLAITACLSLFGARFSFNDSYLKLYPHYEPSPKEEPRIPLIIHQIWIGPPMPPLLKRLAQTWQKKHPNWKYKLWTNKDIRNFQWINKDAFNNASNYGMKSDIWRYEILYRYGGVYIDTDFECIKPLDKFHYLVNFYTGLSKFPGVVYNAIIGTAPGHPFMKKCIDEIKKKPIPKKISSSQILKRTGPYFFTTQIIKNLSLFEGTPYVFFPDRKSVV